MVLLLTYVLSLLFEMLHRTRRYSTRNRYSYLASMLANEFVRHRCFFSKTFEKPWKPISRKWSVIPTAKTTSMDWVDRYCFQRMFPRPELSTRVAQPSFYGISVAPSTSLRIYGERNNSKWKVVPTLDGFRLLTPFVKAWWSSFCQSPHPNIQLFVRTHFQRGIPSTKSGYFMQMTFYSSSTPCRISSWSTKLQGPESCYVVDRIDQPTI